MRLLLSGYYGFGNLGDEALLQVIVSQIRMRHPYADIEVLSATPNETAHELNVEATQRWESKAIRRAISRADVVLSGGGGLLQDATSLRSLIYYAGILRAAVRARRKTMIFAQSIGPLDFFGRKVVREFCKGVDAATVRDERSLELLAALLPTVRAERSADPVFLYEPPDEETDLSSEGLGPLVDPLVIVNVRKAGALRDRIESIARAVDRLAEHHGARIAFLPLGGAGDAEASTQVIRRCRTAAVLLPECSLARATNVIRRAKAVVAMRLHALVLAARWSVPFLAIPYDPKVSALCSDLAYPLPPLLSMEARSEKPTAQAVDDLVDRLMSECEAIAAHLSRLQEHLRRLALRNFEVLDELVAGR